MLKLICSTNHGTVCLTCKATVKCVLRRSRKNSLKQSTIVVKRQELHTEGKREADTGRKPEKQT